MVLIIFNIHTIPTLIDDIFAIFVCFSLRKRFAFGRILFTFLKAVAPYLRLSPPTQSVPAFVSLAVFVSLLLLVFVFVSLYVFSQLELSPPTQSVPENCICISICICILIIAGICICIFICISSFEAFSTNTECPRKLHFYNFFCTSICIYITVGICIF